MSAPLTKTFYGSPIAKELNATLKRVNKTFDDVEYVKYSLAHSNCQLSNYYCNISDFLEATVYATSIYDMNWPFEVSFVGNGFWLDYDYRGICNVHIPPVKPTSYKYPLPQDMFKE